MRSTGRRGSLVPLVLLLLIVVGLIGFWYMRPTTFTTPGAAAVGTTGTLNPREQAARDKGSEVGAKVAVTAEKLKENVAEASLTTKIKAKMALDDSVKARAIDVTTSGTTVTLTGTVRSGAEHDRALALTRETAGVTRVVDRLEVR
jgi:hyperosmotically inducible periplasmic protein